MGRKKLDLTNKRSGMLVAKKIIGRCEKSGGTIWECECDCGGKAEVLASGFFRRTSCGCSKWSPPPGKHTTFKTVDEKSIKLEPGFTHAQFLLKLNENVPYFEICKAMKLNFGEVVEIYDSVYNLELEQIGSLSTGKRMVKPCQMCGEPMPGAFPQRKYCMDCSVIKEKERTKERWAKKMEGKMEFKAETRGNE